MCAPITCSHCMDTCDTVDGQVAPYKPNILASGCLGSKLIVWDIYKERAFKFAFIGDNQSIDSIDFHPT